MDSNIGELSMSPAALAYFGSPHSYVLVGANSGKVPSSTVVLSMGMSCVPLPEPTSPVASLGGLLLINILGARPLVPTSSGASWGGPSSSLSLWNILGLLLHVLTRPGASWGGPLTCVCLLPVPTSSAAPQRSIASAAAGAATGLSPRCVSQSTLRTSGNRRAYGLWLIKLRA